MQKPFERKCCSIQIHDWPDCSQPGGFREAQLQCCAVNPAKWTRSSLNSYGVYVKVYFHCAHTWKLPDGVYSPVNVQTAAHHIYGLLWLDPILVKAKTGNKRLVEGVDGSVALSVNNNY